jgi:hypothetical protein
MAFMKFMELGQSNHGWRYTGSVMPTGREGYREEERLEIETRGLDPVTLTPMLTRPAGLVSTGEIASLIHHWIKNHVPTTQIEEISILATAVIGDQEKAMKWLSEPNLAMGNRPPIDFVGEKDGYERVKNLLLRIEYGALA